MAARKPFQPKFRFHLNDSHELETVWLNAFEGISMSFRLQLHVVCKEELSFESFLGKKGVLSISSDTHYDDADETRYLNGVVMSARIDRREASDSKEALITFTSWWWRRRWKCSDSSGHRVFSSKRPPGRSLPSC